MPTVNTLVVDRADLLGLGQLHQLRGRVGRPGQRAYAYLFTPDRALTEEAYERLKTIGEATELGSASRSPCATSRSAAPATCSVSASPATSPRSATTLLPDGHGGRRRAEGRDADRAGRGQDRPCPSTPTSRRTTSPREELRLEAYRRLASVTTETEGRRHPRSSGRTATGRCPTPPRRCSAWPACGPSAPASTCGDRRDQRDRRSAGRRSSPASRPLVLKTSQPDPPPSACRPRRSTRRTWASSRSPVRRADDLVEHLVLLPPPARARGRRPDTGSSSPRSASASGSRRAPGLTFGGDGVTVG